MLESVQYEMGKFAKSVVKQSRANLSRSGHKDTNNLYGSLGYDLQVHKNSFSLSFYMEEYGAFVDEGVRGANPSLVKNGRQKGGSSPFSFSNKRPPMAPILKWVKSKGLRMRSKDGKFSKGSQKTLSFLIQRSIYAQGIKPSLFFTKPFEKAFDRLPNEVLEQFGLDIDEFIEQTLNN
jgi:hypothetical protein